MNRLLVLCAIACATACLEVSPAETAGGAREDQTDQRAPDEFDAERQRREPPRGVDAGLPGSDAAPPDDELTGPDAGYSSDAASSCDGGSWSGEGMGGGEGTAGNASIPAGQMTASAWSDLQHWDFWDALQDDPSVDGTTWAEHLASWGFDGFDRIAVEVSDGEQRVVDVAVVLRDAVGTVLWEARTDASGRAYLFAGQDGAAQEPLRVAVAQEGCEASAQVADRSAPLQLELACAPPPPVLDLAFVIDTTGSMGDELQYIQAELGDVISRLRPALGQEQRVRLSVNFYRDQGDAYVVRAFPFSEDVETVLGQLRAQRSDGGGDWEEAVEQALASAILEHRWSDRASNRLLFLVCDAPPHKRGDVISRLHGLLADAAAAGIRIMPIAGTGIDKDTELLLRAFAISTGGSYVFITDHSGIGGDHLDPEDETVPDPELGPRPTIPEVAVELLNDLLVRLIVEAVAPAPDAPALTSPAE